MDKNFTPVQSTNYAEVHPSSLLHLYSVHHNKLGLTKPNALYARGHGPSR